MKYLIGILFGLFLLGAVILFFCRKRDPIDHEAGVKLDGQE